MEKKYMVEMWDVNGKGYDGNDIKWYYEKPKQAEIYAQNYLTQKGGGVYVVLYVFNAGHYRTVKSGTVDLIAHVA